MGRIVDQFGREIPPLTKPEAGVVASMKLNDRYSVYPSRGLTPEKLANIFLQADQGDVYYQAELFEEMEEKDTHLSAELLKRKTAVNALEYDVIPYEEGARLSAFREKKSSKQKKADKVCDFCRDVIFSMTDFEDAIFDLLDAIGKGFAASEIIWDVDGGKNIVTDLKWIHQKRLTFAGSIEPKLLNQDSEQTDIPPFKVVYHRHKARSGHDTRAGLLRVCAWMYLFKNYAIKDWVAFAEVFGMPIRLGKYDPGASKDDKDALLTAIQAIGSDAAGIISKSTEIEFVEAVKSASKDNLFETLGNFCNKEMSKAILGGTLTTEVDGKGSYAASETHNDVRHDLTKSDASALSKTIRAHLLRPLVGFNFGWDTPVPWFKIHCDEPEDLEHLSTVYKNLVEMGQPIAQEHVSERFGVPLPEAGQTVLTGPTFGLPMKRGVVMAKRFSPEQRRIEGLVGAAAGRTDEVMKGLLEPVRELVAKAGSLEEIREKIIDLYDDMDSGELEQMIGQAMFAAEMFGRGSVTNA